MKKSTKLLILSLFIFIITVSFVFTTKDNNNKEINATDVDNPTLSVYKKNISYSSEIYIMYAISYEGFDPATYPVKMLFYNTPQDDYNINNASYVNNVPTNTTIAGVNCLIFNSKGLAAKNMTEDIYARAYVEINDEIIYSEVVKYSVLEYTYEAMGKVNEKITDLLLAMKEYGAKAQINFNYNLDRLANATYYEVEILNGSLSDGFTNRRCQANEEFTITAPIVEGVEFENWTNSNGEEIGTELTITTSISQNERLTANYKEIAPVEVYLTKEVAYDATSDTFNLPETVSFEYNDESKEEAVTWDTSIFVENQIGKQKIYGTLVNSEYLVKEVSIELEVLPYTFKLNETTNSYEISKYYGTESEVTLPSTFNNLEVTSIGSSAFASCKTLTSVEIASTIKTIGTSAFSSCSNITNLVIPFGVEVINSSAFYGCSGLTEIIIPNSVKTIDTAFRGCSKLEKISIPFIGKTANDHYGYDDVFGYIFDYTTRSRYSSTYSGTCQYDDGDDYYYYNIPSSLTEVIITGGFKIKDYAFYRCGNIVNIEIPSTITSFGNSTFNYCSGLENLYFDGSVEKWTSYSIPDNDPAKLAEHFYIKNSNNEWEETNELIISSSLTTISKYKFSGYNWVKEIVIPEEITCIEEYAFYGCENLTSLFIPSTVTEIKSNAFSSCYNLVEVEFAENSQLTSMGYSTFYSCSNIEKMIIPFVGSSLGDSYAKLKDIFGGTSSDPIPASLKEVIITGGEIIGESAFYNCQNITDITIKKGVETIEDYAFSQCTSLKNINIGSCVTTIGYAAFRGCSSLESIDIPSSITFIDSYAFENCTNLSQINFANNINITRINTGLFLNCTSLTDIEIPVSIEIVFDLAFSGCSNLTNVYYKGTQSDWNNITIYSSNDPLTNATIHYEYVKVVE